MAEIRYRSDTAEAVFRKSAGIEDISGDFNSYDTVQELTVGDITATLKGNSGSICWQSGPRMVSPIP